MLVRLQGVLSQEQLEVAIQLLRQCRFHAGAASAGERAAPIKHNEEVVGDDPQLRPLNNLVMGALLRHPVYRGAALARSVAAPFYSRYTEGMGYGSHIDDPIMGEGPRYRSDIAITLFLSEPAGYGGGELVVENRYGEQVIKYPAGDAVMYPAASLHRVETITHGERLAAVTWVQSLVRDAYRRELLYELFQAREQLLREAPALAATRQIEQAYANLVRLWAEV